MNLKNLVLIAILSFSGQTICAQPNIKHFDPVILNTPDLSKKAQKEFARQMELIDRTDLTDAENTELTLLIEKYGAGGTSVWDVITEGCSWYCEGGNYKIEASSALAPQGKNYY